MPAVVLYRRLQPWGISIPYLLDDEFTDIKAAGAFLGTPAVPGPGDRQGVDTNLIMSTAGGVLVVNGTPAASDRFHPGSVARVAGRVFKVALPTFVTNGAANIRFGFSADGTTGTDGVPGIDYNASITAIRIKDNVSVIYTFTLGAAPHEIALIARATGGWSFAKVGANWVMLYIHPTNSTATLFPKFIVATAAAINLTVDGFRVPQSLYIPTPLAYATFGGGDGALGNTDATGPDGQVVAVLAWTGATWAIVSGKAVNTPNLGADVVVNGDFDTDTDWTKGAGWSIAAGVASATAASSDLTAVVAPLTLGQWYQVQFTLSSFVGGTVRPILGGTNQNLYGANGTHVLTGRAGGTSLVFTAASATLSIDDVSVKPLILSELFASVNSVSTPDVHIRVAITLDGAPLGKATGIVLNLDSVSSPANLILAWLDGRGNAHLDECVAGVWTSKIAAAITYSAGALLYVIRSGTSAWMFYNNAQVGTVQTMTENTNKLFGMFKTSPLCSLDAFEVWPYGTGGEHGRLGTM